MDLPLSFQTDSNKLELKTSSRIYQESLVVSHKGQSLALFCILLINDLEYVVSDKESFKFFADDLKVYSIFNIPSYHNNLHHSLDLIVLWSESLQFPIHLSKTQLIQLGMSNNVHNYLINSITSLPADNVLGLCIITDSDLSHSSIYHK